MSTLTDLTTPRLREDWSEEDGDVLWWDFPITEAPYLGTPLDTGRVLEVHDHAGKVASFNVGGWPGYHTHWTPLPPAPKSPTR